MTLLPEFHDQLHVAASRQARRRLRQRIAVPQTRLGTILVPLLSILVAVTVGAIALTAGGAGPGAAPVSRPSSVASSRTELLLTLGALRTPQSAADRRALRSGGFQGLQTGPIAARLMKNPQYRRMLRAQGYPRIDQPLVRTVRLASGGALTLVPMTFQPTTAHIHGLDRPVTFTLHGPRIEGLALELRLPGTGLNAESATSVAVLRAQGVSIVTYDRGRNVGAIVVPDGVTKVTLSAFRAPRILHLTRFRIPTVTASVHDNVAVFHVVAPRVTTHGRGPGDPMPGLVSADAYTRMTWFGAQGQILNRTTIDIPFNFIVRAHH